MDRYPLNAEVGITGGPNGMTLPPTPRPAAVWS